MTDFHRTIMGRKFYESDLPSLTKALENVAKQMEIQNIREEKKFRLEEKLMKAQLRDINEQHKLPKVDPEKVIKTNPVTGG